MFHDAPTIPERSFRPTVPIRVHAPRIRVVPAVERMDRAAFDAICWYAPSMTTPVAWFRRTDDAAIGVVIRDHRSTSFSIVTLLLRGDGFVLDQRRDRFEERHAAEAELFELLGAT